MHANVLQEMPLMRKKEANDEDKQVKPAAAAGSIVSCCVTLPDGSVCDVDISVR